MAKLPFKLFHQSTVFALTRGRLKMPALVSSASGTTVVLDVLPRPADQINARTGDDFDGWAGNSLISQVAPVRGISKR